MSTAGSVFPPSAAQGSCGPGGSAATGGRRLGDGRCPRSTCSSPSASHLFRAFWLRRGRTSLADLRDGGTATPAAPGGLQS